MNLRQHKRQVLARMFYNNGIGWFPAAFSRSYAAPDWVGHNDPRLMKLAELVEELPNIAPEYQCVKVNGGEVVDTFQTRSEALALVQKHYRQKKAKLHVINTDTGEVEIFTDEEMA